MSTFFVLFKYRAKYYIKEYNNFPMRPLKWLSPNDKYKEYIRNESSIIGILILAVSRKCDICLINLQSYLQLWENILGKSWKMWYYYI